MIADKMDNLRRGLLRRGEDLQRGEFLLAMAQLESLADDVRALEDTVVPEPARRAVQTRGNVVVLDAWRRP